MILSNTNLRNDVTNDRTVDVGQPEVAAIETVRQLLVVETQQVKDGRMQIVDMHAVLDSMVTEVVGGAVNHAALDAASREPHRVAVGIVVATIALGKGGAAELAAPRHQRLCKKCDFQHT